MPILPEVFSAFLLFKYNMQASYYQRLHVYNIFNSANSISSKKQMDIAIKFRTKFNLS